MKRQGETFSDQRGSNTWRPGGILIIVSGNPGLTSQNVLNSNLKKTQLSDVRFEALLVNHLGQILDLVRLESTEN